MFIYYVKLAFAGFKRNMVLSLLTVLTVAIGIGGAMSTFTIYHVMSGDPIPDKSGKLFVPQFDSLGPQARGKSDEPPDLLSYREVLAFMRAPVGEQYAAMYPTRMTITPSDPSLSQLAVSARATQPAFFRMFDTPFQAGAPWTAADEEARARVVVLSARTAERLFSNRNAVGKTLTLDGEDYRVVGVLGSWNPTPRFYDLSADALAQPEGIYLPFATAIDRHMESNGHTQCDVTPDPGAGWQGLLNSNCVWLQYWVQLPDATAADRYRAFLTQYAAEQERSGRFSWLPMVRLRNVRQWLVYKQVVPNELRVIVLLGFGFLLVCMVNAVGLMLARLNGRYADLGVRRALGATKGDVLVQCIADAAFVGTLGGACGLLLTVLGASAERAIVADSLARVTHVDDVLVLVTLLLAVMSTIVAGLYPAWRASRIPPAMQLRAR